EVVAVAHTTQRSVTLTVRPNAAFAGVRAGQHVVAGLEIDGRRVTRCYSPANAEGAELLELTVGLHDGGHVSTWLREHARPGLVLDLEAGGGEFVLPDPLPERIAFVSGGSGITPVIAMLRTLRARGHDGDITFLHYARSAAEACYRDELARSGVRVLHGFTRDTAGSDVGPRFDPALVGDAAVFACGPPALVDAVREHCEDVRSESFVPPVFEIPADPSGGTVSFAASGVMTTDDGRSLLEQAEAAGLKPDSGCRMGICHTCTCRKTSGAVRNLITGAVSTAGEEDVQICISAPLGDVALAI
ncbi:MAG TPA: iron-sulfur cluster-binding domain-containing protein, partial [Solirubrobacteraceae bacterium]